MERELKATLKTRQQGRETPVSDLDVGAVEGTIQRAQQHLLSLQSKKGYWVGELEADASVTAGYIPLMYFMVGEVDPARKKKAITYALSKQASDGSWPSYHGGPGDLSVSVQVYFALKLGGVSAEEPFMQKAREFILDKGGITGTKTLTKIWLAIFGQFDWRGTPSLPVEVVLFPNRFPFNIYDFASWSRATIVALAVILTNRPVCTVPSRANIGELYAEPEGVRRRWAVRRPKGVPFIGWRSFFVQLDGLLKTVERLPVKPGRKSALRRAEKWIVGHQEADGSWGGIMLPWVYSLMALKSLGHDLSYPAIEKGLQGLDGFIVEDNETMRLQPATSPVWDTAWTAIALKQSGLANDHQALLSAAQWLLNEEVRSYGDWRVKNRHTEPGGWAFEFDNDIYPDIDDTAVVPRALMGVKLDGEARRTEAIMRAVKWAVDMQCDNGGWAAFDRNNNKLFLKDVPFADFMTPLDPTSPDVTAHMLELLGELKEHKPSVSRALSYIKSEQTADGAWYGRWGVNYIYGTGLVIAGLRAVGEDMAAGYVRKAVGWLESRQNADGGWGETCHTYVDPLLKGAGDSTASQTAWALIGLTAAGEWRSQAVTRGVKYLMQTQEPAGSWKEDNYTGTGFPGAFYLRYDLYRNYFPLLALANYRKLAGGER